MGSWRFQHSLDCLVSKAFAWQFWTTVSNWPTVDSSLESVTLDGPFCTGTTGSTKPRGRQPIRWQLAEVDEGRSAVIEIAVPGAVLRCAWTFEEIASQVTRITQVASIEGARASDYVETVAPDLERGIPQGMGKLAEAIERAARSNS